jgi:hypothetical protein
MNAPLPDINALSDAEAIRLLALVADHTVALPDAAHQRQLETHLREAADEPEEPDTAEPISEGDLARAALEYLAEERRHVVALAASVPPDGSRFEPTTLAVGALVILALQTEVDFNRDKDGRWRLRVHKKAMREATLAKLIGKVLTLYRQPRA